ncbi:recombinase family protein [Sulfurimonas sp. HSL-1716]|uniref:recombinase family protein n=1 Tax=Hydrocurvibacter sulfurireducens TaxID=3131937 RepID=UPI0031F75B68
MTTKLETKRDFTVMVHAYIRSDKNFETAYEQLKVIDMYAEKKKINIDDRYIDQKSQNKRLRDRDDVVNYFKSGAGGTLLVYDTWTLTTNMEDAVQIFSCLLKNEYEVHFVKQSVIISKNSDVMLILGIIDQLRRTLQESSKRSIGRPKGSHSSSKFDKYHNEIISHIKADKSVSEIARLLQVSRSSLKDYIESRELKEIALGSLVHKIPEDAEETVINKIACPITTK